MASNTESVFFVIVALGLLISYALFRLYLSHIGSFSRRPALSFVALLVFGLLFSLIYFFVDLNSEKIGVEKIFNESLYTEHCSIAPFSEYVYFSFVSILTVGFGGVHPVTPIGKAIVTLQSVIGFLAFGVFVSSLLQSMQRHFQRAWIEKIEYKGGRDLMSWENGDRHRIHVHIGGESSIFIENATFYIVFGDSINSRHSFHISSNRIEGQHRAFSIELHQDLGKANFEVLGIIDSHEKILGVRIRPPEATKPSGVNPLTGADAEWGVWLRCTLLIGETLTTIGVKLDPSCVLGVIDVAGKTFDKDDSYSERLNIRIEK